MLGANWTATNGTTGTAPTTGDTAFIGPVPGLTLASISFADMHTITLAALVISAGLPQTFTIGTQATTSGSSFGYLRISATLVTIGAPVASSGNGNIGNTALSGAGRIKLDLGTAASAVLVQSTGNSIDSSFEPCRILANNSATTLTVESGLVGVATNLPGETSTIASAIATGSGSSVNIGPGVTCPIVKLAASAGAYVECAVTTMTVAAGCSVTTIGTGSIATLNNYGSAIINSRATATIGTFNAYGGGVTNFSGNPATATITNTNYYTGAGNGGAHQIIPFQAQAGVNQVIFTNQPIPFGPGVMTVA